MPLIPAPSLALLGLEPLRFVMEYVSVRLMDRASLPRGDGHPVVLFPGLGADHSALGPLVDCCRSLGYAASDWGRGLNTGPQGDIDTWVDALVDGVADVSNVYQRRVSLVGWSLGGIYAREIARRRPDLVRQVITLGTPFAGSGEHTNVGWIYKLLSGHSARIDPGFSARLRATPPVPTTSIYSKSDGIVAWQACLEARVPRAENVEVEGSHIGLVCQPMVWRVVADRLAQPDGQWRPFRR
jgi:predicted esterase